MQCVVVYVAVYVAVLQCVLQCVVVYVAVYVAVLQRVLQCVAVYVAPTEQRYSNVAVSDIYVFWNSQW
jgi:hypothetical protein